MYDIHLKAMGQIEHYLRRIYFDPKHPGGFASADKLYQAVQREGKYKVNRGQIKTWLESVDAYTMNRPVIRRPDRRRTRNKIPVQTPFELWDGDLMDMRTHAKVNEGYAYILVLIDVFSRFLWTRPLKTKTMSEVKQAMVDVMEKAGQAPQRLRTDGGKEFTGHIMKGLYKGYGLYHYVAHNESKATYAERVIQTIKRILYRYMIHKNELRWVKVLPKLTQNYNATYHTSIKMAPEQVNSSNQDQVWANQFLIPALKHFKTPLKQEGEPSTHIKKIKYKVKVGDYVRISHTRHAFERVYDQKFSGEIFKVAKRYTRQDIPLYRLEDMAGDLLEGAFYGNEIERVRVNKNKQYKIDKIMKYKTVKKQKLALVRWLFWPPKFDSWVPVSTIKDIRPT